jgi:hypothetical protein
LLDNQATTGQASVGPQYDGSVSDSPSRGGIVANRLIPTTANDRYPRITTTANARLAGMDGLAGKEIQMATTRLRVYDGPSAEPEADHESNSPGVPIRLVELYPLLAQAFRDNFVWLRDFEDDELLVSNDLFEVVRAFSDYRPSA